MLGVHRRRKTFHVKALDFDRTLPIQAKACNDDWGRAAIGRISLTF